MNDQMTTSNVFQQYEYLPYPTAPVEKITPTPEQLFNYCCATAYHTKCQQMPSGVLRILDVGCGTGFKTMLLAAANPGCSVTGLDFSPKSLEVARQRAGVCGFPEVTFHELAIEEIATLGETWDYINCQDVVYMMPDSVKALAALRSVLSEDGIIRFDFHARYGRRNMLRAQAACKMLGLIERNPEENEVELVRELMKGLNANVDLKQRAWGVFVTARPCIDPRIRDIP